MRACPVQITKGNQEEIQDLTLFHAYPVMETVESESNNKDL